MLFPPAEVFLLTLACISVIMMYDLYRELRINVGTHILGTFFGG